MSEPSSPTSGRAHQTGSWRSLAAGVLFNALTLVGVIVFDWPAANVFLLFWIENAVIGIVTIPKVATARGPGSSTMTVNGVPREMTPAAAAVFFCAFYGIFCVVHLVFTLLLAWRLGVEWSLFALGVPAALIVMRYIIETVLTWFGDRGRRERVSPRQAMFEPYPRIFVLHAAVLLGFAMFVVGNSGPARMLAELRSTLEPMVGGSALTDEIVAIVLLLVIKTGADVHFTRRALNGAGRVPPGGSGSATVGRRRSSRRGSGI